MNIKISFFLVIDILTSKLKSVDTMLKDFDLMRDSFQISNEIRDESNQRYDRLHKEINKNRIRFDDYRLPVGFTLFNLL